MSRHLFSLVGGLLRAGIFPKGFFSLGQARQRYSILIFHRVLETPDPFAMAPILASEFDALVGALKSVFEIRPLHELVAASQNGTLPARGLALTFDDGYRDNDSVALPILRKHGVPATIFLATGLIGTGQCAWYDRVLEAFRYSTLDYWDGKDLLPGTFPFSEPAKTAQVAFQVLEKLKQMPPVLRDSRIEQLENELKVSRQYPALMLNWEEARHLRDSGLITLGAHTQSHPILSRISDEAIEREIRNSQADMHRELGEAPRLFAYPNGRKEDFDARSKKVLREAGFAAAVTTEPGVNSAQTEVLHLLRLQAWDPNPWAMSARIGLELLKG